MAVKLERFMAHQWEISSKEAWKKHTLFGRQYRGGVVPRA